MNNKTKKEGRMPRFGYIPSKTHPITYAIGDSPLPCDPLDSDAESSGWKGERDGMDYLSPLMVGEFYVWPAGPSNDDPTVCKELIKGNRLFPSLIEKQISILYGHGVRLYKESVAEDGTISRTYVQDAEVSRWLDSWREHGLPEDVKTYVIKCIRSYYHSEGVFSQWHLSVAASMPVRIPGTLPVLGLEHISETRARFCSRHFVPGHHDVTLNDFDLVMVGNWASGFVSNEYKVYRRMDYRAPLAHNSVVSYSRNPNHGEEVYATNVFFAGIKEWIRGTNATPAYINSFLRNSLSARHHVIIPNAWMRAKEEQLGELCEMNAQRQAQGLPLKTISLGRGAEWTIEVGTEYSPDLLERYVQLELKKLTEFLSGRGKNQGKVFATRSVIGDSGKEESWQINEISQKYQEYIKALIDYDKRADNVLLAAKGIDASISNISSDGTFSKSGSEAYYNYVIYLTQQTIPEEVVCADLNYAVRLNWPDKYAAGLRVGFFRPTVQRQQDISPKDRLTNKEEL